MMPAMAGLVEFVRGRIAVKLTLTLVGFVALSMAATSIYLTRALEAFAVDALEARLVTAARLLHDDARSLLLRPASPAVDAFVRRSATPTGARITLIAVDGTDRKSTRLNSSHLGISYAVFCLKKKKKKK